ncbi:MAG: ferrous iron transport protein B [Candidatus Riflebacteria bacterium GWC2_50_8]|nr:MAG: ferrous iron transport protein B [Candidatus Riflebacteria bacterium GWC2_50_8]
MTGKIQRSVYLVGNPNSGKTSLFNAMTGERRRVGNWPGVTVQKLEGITNTDLATLTICDLPGTYSLTPATPEEEVVLKTIDEAATGCIVNVVDIANFERNLFLTTQLIELGIRPVVSLNCFDSFTKAGGTIDLQKFSAYTCTTPFPTVARTGEGTKNLVEFIGQNAAGISSDAGNWLSLPSIWLDATEQALKSKGLRWDSATATQRYAALSDLIRLHPAQIIPELIEIRQNLAKKLSEGRERPVKTTDLACELASDRYRRIEKLIAACAVVPGKNIPAWQEKLDRVLTHRFFGLPMFALMMAWIFWTTFSVGEIPMGWMHSLVEALSDFVQANMQESLIKEMLVGGVISGVGGVIIFIPNILILFFWIAILEDSGYMSRAAFIMDKMMNSIGLHGRAFIPMIMGLGCNVPAVLATRIIDNRFQRLLTMLLIPLVTCAARLPVLVLLCGTFFPENPSMWMFSLFFVNLLVLIFLGQFISVIFKTTENSPFLLEMPPYRLPTPSSVFHMLYEKGAHFVEKAGTVILAGAIIIWVLSVFPREVPLSCDYEMQLTQLRSQEATDEVTAKIADLSHKRDIELLEGRYMARLGKFMHPVMAPLGFSWRETVSLIPGFLAKESVVSTLAVLYLPYSEHTGDAMRKTGMTPLTAFVFMTFTLLYIPCIATLGVMWRESGSTRFTVLCLVAYFAIAYGVSYVTLKIGTVLQGSSGMAWFEGMVIITVSLFAGWYLLKTFIVTISGSKCNSCASCNSCPTKSKQDCSGGCP